MQCTIVTRVLLPDLALLETTSIILHECSSKRKAPKLLNRNTGISKQRCIHWPILPPKFSALQSLGANSHQHHITWNT